MMGVQIKVWPEFAKTLKIAADRLRAYTHSTDWTDLDEVASYIEEAEKQQRGVSTGTVMKWWRDNE
jgi:hypothetical protein